MSDIHLSEIETEVIAEKLRDVGEIQQELQRLGEALTGKQKSILRVLGHLRGVPEDELAGWALAQDKDGSLAFFSQAVILRVALRCTAMHLPPCSFRWLRSC